VNGRDVLTPADVKAILDKKLVDASAQSNLTVSVDDVARLIRGEKGLPDDAEAQACAARPQPSSATRARADGARRALADRRDDRRGRVRRHREQHHRL
jgi:hypothetical protein